MSSVAEFEYIAWCKGLDADGKPRWARIADSKSDPLIVSEAFIAGWNARVTNGEEAR